MAQAIDRIRQVTVGSPFEGRLWLVGGAVRDKYLGLEHSDDFDIVLEGDALATARFLFASGITESAPALFPRFGTAMVRIDGVQIEFSTARRESYQKSSRKPRVEGASLKEDAERRDFTINSIFENLHTAEIFDPAGGRQDLVDKVLRTPTDPIRTFHDDPLRMLRAIRFRWRFDLAPASGLYEAIAQEAGRLEIVSGERIQAEITKILLGPLPEKGIADVMELGLFSVFGPELLPMVGVEQGKYHHLDVWNHSLAVLANVSQPDLVLRLAALLHDIGKPSTRLVDEKGDTRFFGHEVEGVPLARAFLRRLRFSNDVMDQVSRLIKNHMRIGSSPSFSKAAARRLLREMGTDTERLLDLVEADIGGLRAGVKGMDIAAVRHTIAEVETVTPRSTLASPLDGKELMRLAKIEPGKEVARLKGLLTELVLEGKLAPDDKASAVRIVLEELNKKAK